MLTVHLRYTDQCFVNPLKTFFFCWLLHFFSCFHVFFLLPDIMRGKQRLSTPIKRCCCPEAITQQNGRHRQRRGMGPIILLTTDFIPRVKGLLSVTFTWFKSLAQLNQKSMKSFGYIFGLSCQHFKLGTGCCCSCWVLFFFWHRPEKKYTEEYSWPSSGWNLTTHWKISPIAFMGLCRNGKYTRKIRKEFEKNK